MPPSAGQHPTSAPLSTHNDNFGPSMPSSFPVDAASCRTSPEGVSSSSSCSRPPAPSCTRLTRHIYGPNRPIGAQVLVLVAEASSAHSARFKRKNPQLANQILPASDFDALLPNAEKGGHWRATGTIPRRNPPLLVLAPRCPAPRVCNRGNPVTISTTCSSQRRAISPFTYNVTGDCIPGAVQGRRRLPVTRPRFAYAFFPPLSWSLFRSPPRGRPRSLAAFSPLLSLPHRCLPLPCKIPSNGASYRYLEQHPQPARARCASRFL